MASQTGKNMWVAFFTEDPDFDTAPGVGEAAEKIRINPSPGLNLTRANIAPGEFRADLMTQMSRLGSNMVSGSYNCDLSISSFDTILEAIFRSDWAGAVAITDATMVSITTTGSTIVATEGSWITRGVRVGDIVRLTGIAEPLNVDINLTVKSIFTDEMLTIATLAIGTAKEKFATTTTAIYTIAGASYSKAAEDDIVFSGTSTINTLGAAATTHWGTFLIQVNDAGAVSTKPGAFTDAGTDQDYASEALAIAELAIPDADHTQLGYITVQGKDGVAWIEATSDMDPGVDCETATFYDLVGDPLARTITVEGAPLTGGGPDTTFTLTILKKLMNASVPKRRTFYIDEYNQDIDMSEVYGGCRFTGLTIRGGPDSMATIEIRVIGASQTALATGGASPYYTAATLRTEIGLVFVDATIARDGTALTAATSFELNIDLNAQALPVIGATVTPDVFDNEMTISGSLSMLREDLSYITALGAETEYTLQLLLVEPDATDPIDCFNMYIPRIKFTGVDTPLGQDGGMIQTCPFVVGMQPGDTLASGIDETMMTICTETIV